MSRKRVIESDEINKESTVEDILNDIQNSCGKESILRLSGKIEKIPVIPTGILPLDVALGVGGIPKGRICEFFGTEGGGKTTVSFYVIAECQRNGGIAAFIDVEQTFDPGLAKACGVDLSKLILSQPDSADLVFKVVERILDSKKVDLVVIDSVAAIVTISEMEKGLNDISAGRVGEQANMMSTVLRRLNPMCRKSGTTLVFINQLRSQINTGYSHGPSESTPGGRALKFYSSIRLDVRKAKTITKGDDVIGHEMVIKVVKNKVAPPFKKAQVSLIYGKGIPEDISYVEMALNLKIFKQKGPWISYRDETLGQGKDAVANKIADNPVFKEEIRSLIMECVSAKDDESDDTYAEEEDFDEKSDAQDEDVEMSTTHHLLAARAEVGVFRAF